MDIKFEKDPVPIITVNGEVDYNNADRLNSVVKKACESRSCIFDLTETTYLDSAGVQSIFLAIQLNREDDGQVIAVINNKNISRVIEISAGELPNFKIVSSLNEAKKELGIEE